MPSPVVTPAIRADWFAARALLATRRLRPFAPLGVVAFVAVIGAFLALRGPVANRAAAARRTAVQLQAKQHDTLALAAAVRTSRAVLAMRDTALQAMSLRAAQASAVPVLSSDSRRTRDSLQTLVSALDAALERASKAPLAASYRALAGVGALHGLGDVRALVDSLDALDRLRLSLDPAATPQSVFAQLAERTNSIGKSLQVKAHSRRASLAGQMLTVEGRKTAPSGQPSPAEDTSATRAARDSAREQLIRADASLRAARQWLMANDARADSAARAEAERILGASPVAAATAAIVLTGVLVFTLALAVEVRHPAIAHAREAERLTGVPVHAVAAAAMGAAERSGGYARLRLGEGIDPFRMVYLALASSGPAERTVCVTGDHPDTVAVVAGRLASSAAEDDRATLLVDLAPDVPTATRYFAARSEPGFTEAIAGVRLWREVACSVGASEGLSIDVVPAGARRQDTGVAVAAATNQGEFHLFAGQYDFTVIAAPTRQALALAAVLCPRSSAVHVARRARTTLATLVDDVQVLNGLELNLHGILLVE